MKPILNDNRTFYAATAVLAWAHTADNWRDGSEPFRRDMVDDMLRDGYSLLHGLRSAVQDAREAEDLRRLAATVEVEEQVRLTLEVSERLRVNMHLRHPLDEDAEAMSRWTAVRVAALLAETCE